MAVFQTAGDPPSIGRTSRVTIGWTTNTRAAEVKMARANSQGVRRSATGAAGLRSIAASLIRPSRPGPRRQIGGRGSR